MIQNSELQAALSRGLAPGGDLREELSAVEDCSLFTREDALAVVETLRSFPRAESDDGLASALHAVLALFQQVESEEAFETMGYQGMPELHRIYDALLEADCEEHSGDLSFILKVYAMYGSRGGAERIVNAARDPILQDSWLWSVVFQQIEVEWLEGYLTEHLRDPLPDGFAAVAFLDFVNRLARQEKLEYHPFNTPQGVRRLENWLATNDAEQYSFAHSATASLPFVEEPHRGRLLALALDHADIGVQMEAAWASAMVGGEAGVKVLARRCLDCNTAVVALEYLRELKREDAIPAESQDPGFLAMSEMCHWLSHPNEFGRPPDRIEVYDTREMFWPPTNDRRRLWLLRYWYDAEPESVEEQGEGSDEQLYGDASEWDIAKEFDDDFDEDFDEDFDNVDDETLSCVQGACGQSVADAGVGMVGSITFALFGTVNVEMSPADIYGMHCCWELQMNQDPRAPEECTAEEGRRILRKYEQA
ncbi:hypothetical protein [Lignipirellula cremea]|nr:hypothetical protein [Lignipirellula cremea]